MLLLQAHGLLARLLPNARSRGGLEGLWARALEERGNIAGCSTEEEALSGFLPVPTVEQAAGLGFQVSSVSGYLARPWLRLTE